MSAQLSFDDTNDDFRQQAAWGRVVARLHNEVPPAWYERFIRTLRLLEITDGTAKIAAPGKYVFEWIQGKYLSTIQTYLSDEIGEHLKIELIPEATEKAQAEANATPITPTVANLNAFHPIERYRFDTFVVGQSNRLAVAGAKAVAAAPGKKYNPLFIYGASGLGKTHLLHAVARELLQHDQRFPLVFVTAQQFAEEFVNALQGNRIDQFRRQQRAVGVWLLDDIQFVAGKDKTQEEIFHTFNYLHGLGKQIVITSDRPPRDLYLMDDRLRSRFEAGLVADVQMPDTETRCAILLSKAEQDGTELPHDIAMYLAESVPGNIRVLEGALTKLVALASMEDEAPNLELAERLVEQNFRSGQLAKPGCLQIMEAVGKHYKVSPEEIKGASRKAPIVFARHVAVYLAREITGDSWNHIGSQFGSRDHTSMMHGYQKISEMLNSDRDLRATIKMLMGTIYPLG
jgi:chromosomal replication initiator protein